MANSIHEPSFAYGNNVMVIGENSSCRSTSIQIMRDNLQSFIDKNHNLVVIEKYPEIEELVDVNGQPMMTAMSSTGVQSLIRTVQDRVARFATTDPNGVVHPPLLDPITLVITDLEHALDMYPDMMLAIHDIVVEGFPAGVNVVVHAAGVSRLQEIRAISDVFNKKIFVWDDRADNGASSMSIVDDTWSMAMNSTHSG